MEQHASLPPEILELVSRSIFRPKTHAERVVLQAAVSGNDAECFPPDGDSSIRTDDPRGWRAEQTIRGGFLQWLIFDVLPARKGTTNRIAISNARFPDGVDISEVTLPAVLLRFANCRFDQQIDVSESHLLSLELDGSWAPTLVAGALVVDKDLSMAGFKCPGKIDFSGSRVDGSLIANDCILGSGPTANGNWKTRISGSLDAVNLEVHGDILLTNSKVQGAIYLYGATIGGSLDCGGMEIDGGDSFTVHLEKTTIQGNVLLKTLGRDKVFSSTGCVKIINSTIKNGIDAAGGQFRLPQNAVPTPDMPAGLVIEISSSQGYNFFTSDFSADGVSFQYSELGVVDFHDGKIGALGMDLRKTKAREFIDNRTAWPAKGKLHIAGFTYDQISYKSSPNGKNQGDPVTTRLQWIALDPEPSSQVYKQYAGVLANQGDDNGAKLVNETMQRVVGSSGGPVAKAETLMLSPIKYGYAPENAIFGLLALTGLGWIIYRRNFMAGRITPTEGDAYQEFKETGTVPAHYNRFSALMYSLENTFPLVSLGQAANWQPDPSMKLAEDPAARAAGETALHPVGEQLPRQRLLRARRAVARRLTRQLRAFLWIQILVGWVLATLFLAAIGGLIRR